jgi:hypothetical protein
MNTPNHIQSSIPISFKTKEIEQSLKSTGIYKKGTFIIKQLTDFDHFRQDDEFVSAEEDYVFALQNKDPKTPFLGVVNYYFKREGYCLNTYLNGDIYFGYYKNDLRNKQGLYSFKPTKSENNLLSQFYYGLWENDLFNGNGIYLWLKEKEDKAPFSDYDNANFEAFVGNSNEGKFKKGALISKEGKNYFVYYGNFTNDGKKEGNKCFYYSSNLERLCYGTFENGIFIEGYVGNFDKNGKLSGLIIYKKDGDNTKGEKIKLKKEPEIENSLIKIREIILNKNYLNMIYEEFAKIIKFRDEKMNNIEIIMTEEYGTIIKSFQFNKITLCEDIENNIGL